MPDGRHVCSPDARSRQRHRFELAVRALERRDSRRRSPPRHWAGPRSARPDIATWSGSSGRRASKVTRRARLARKTTAWPAELPPPTSATSCPPQVRLERRGPIMDRRALELLEPLDVEPPVAGAGGDHRRRAPGRSRRWRAAAGTGRCRIRALRASSGIAISTPNFCAWLNARPISAMPEMPVGKPR